jgi:uncharacterized C2H2 Zn-finger protein
MKANVVRRVCVEKQCVKPTKEEAMTLLRAQRDIIKRGNTAVKCPRCGKFLEYTWRASSETIRCVDDNCIAVHTRGL